MNLFEKMSAITAELQTVAKNLKVETSKNNSYKAVSERDVLDAVKPVEAKYGVYSYPASRKVLESNLLESENSYNGKVTKRTTFMTRIETVYRFVNTENPDEWIEMVAFSEGIDSQDKGSGKAMTYADKYALMKAYKISTGDDPDQAGSRDECYEMTSDLISPNQLKIITDYNEAVQKWACRKYSVRSIADLTRKQASELIREANRIKETRNKEWGE